MQDLLITWPEGQARFSPKNSPVLVGRSVDAAVVLTEPAVSRRHLEFVWLGSSWIVNDSSTHGSYDPIGVRLAPTWTVGKEVTVRVGGVAGPEITLRLTEQVEEPEPTRPTLEPIEAETPASVPETTSLEQVDPTPGPSTDSPPDGIGIPQPASASSISSKTPARAAEPSGVPALADSTPRSSDPLLPTASTGDRATLLLGVRETPAMESAASPLEQTEQDPEPPTPPAQDRSGSLENYDEEQTIRPAEWPPADPAAFPADPGDPDGESTATPPSVFSTPSPPPARPSSEPASPAGPSRTNAQDEPTSIRESVRPPMPPAPSPPEAPLSPETAPDSRAEEPLLLEAASDTEAHTEPEGSQSAEATPDTGPEGPNDARSGTTGEDEAESRNRTRSPEVSDGQTTVRLAGSPTVPPAPPGPEPLNGSSALSSGESGPAAIELPPEHPTTNVRLADEAAVPTSVFSPEMSSDTFVMGSGKPPGTSDDVRGPLIKPASAVIAGPDATSVDVVPGAADTIITDQTLRLSVDGQNFTFPPGAEVTVGRDPSSLVHLNERHSLVSRHHLVISFKDDAWWIEDRSSKGTYIDGRKVTRAYRAEGAFVAHLGDDDAGTPMRIITAGEHKQPRSFNYLLVIAVAALVLMTIAALGYVMLGSRQEEPVPTTTESATSTVDLEAAKQATVLLLGEEGIGSGFFVTDNLILTNQHVAVLEDTLGVAVSRTADEPAQVEYLAETVASHPFLDIAVLRLTTDLNGASVASSGLTPVTIGDSRTVVLGDRVYSTGFPVDLSPAGQDDMGDLLLPPVSTTSGEAANFSIWPGCSNPTQAEFLPVDAPAGVQCAPNGDVTQAVIISTFSSGQGASGSPVFKNDQVVAVVFSGPEGNENAGRNIATSAFADWLQEVISENG